MRDKRFMGPAGLALSLLMIIGLWGCGNDTSGKATPVDNSGESAGPVSEWSPEELLMADFLLYNVDCGSLTPEAFPVSEINGLCQSVSDRAYGLDEGSKREWGYISRDYLVKTPDSLGEGLTASKWTIADDTETDMKDVSIEYGFEVPNGTFTVTVGFYNPFGVRKIDVDCEDKETVKSEKILRYKLMEKSFDTVVSDGVLNLKVSNKNGKNFMDSPILSYIRIAITPEYTEDLLRAGIDAMTLADPGETYTKESTDAYLESLERARTLLASDKITAKSVEERFVELRGNYKMLTEKLRYHSFRPGDVWKDTENTPIQAHGGQVQQLEVVNPETGKTETKWVWVGEDKTHGYRGGVCAYSSYDLYNWQFEGIIMRNVSSRKALDTEDYFKDLYAGYSKEQLDNVALSLDAERAVIERPKLIYNEKNKQYVLWFHADGPTAKSDSNYAAACAGVAVSDSPFGPYRFIDRYRLNTCPAGQEDFYPDSKGMARDMNLFKDTDGTAYIIYSSEENYTLYISKLNEDFTYLATEPEKAVYGKDFIRIVPGGHREAPAMFLRDGKYYLMTSGCTGWEPNQASYAVADSVLGEWVNKGDPCKGDDNHTTFDSQSTCVFRDPETDTWIYMGDRWFSDKLNDSRYLWLPVSFKENGDMELSFVAEWSLR
ncbi:MAG: family 43 glycosylhydrolase [Lachnospiraceae bacterium]|nr:family 43 glycosylhydrolase [Lachnospiraceae bacterium]